MTAAVAMTAVAMTAVVTTTAMTVGVGMTAEATEARTSSGAARRRLVLVAVLVAACDWASKLVGSAVLDDRTIELPGIDLRLVHNPGIAFGVASSAPSWLVLSVTSVVVCVLAVAAWRGAFGSPFSAGLVLGGAVANVVDRTLDGTVVDVLDLGWWPTFNLADVAITVGAGLLLLQSLRPQPRPS